MWGEEEEIPSPEQYIDKVFGRGGYLSQRWGDSYQPREGQIELARAVDVSLRARGHLMSEAPTGTGKSLAYSVPATYHAAMGGKVVIIVTANIALQEQLVSKDLPLLGEILPWAFSFGLLKGRNNYLCRSQYEKTRLATRQQPMFNGDQAPREERERLRLMQWAEREIAQGGYGDSADLDWKPTDKHWREVSISSDECRGSKCAFAGTCGALAAQRAAKQCQVIVTNYHVFFSNLRFYMDRGVDVVLPPFDVAIFDEAHKAADIARDFFGWKISEGSVRRVARHYRGAEPKLTEDLERAAGWFFEQMLQLRRDRDRYKARILPQKLSESDVAAAENLIGSLTLFATRLGEEMQGLKSIASGGSRQAQDQLATVEQMAERTAQLIGEVRSVLGNDDEDNDNDVLFIEEDEFKKASVASRMVRPSVVLRQALFGKVLLQHDSSQCPVGPECTSPLCIVEKPVSVICTSATLATEQSFNFSMGELGVEHCTQLVVDSPFDYPNQALLIIPDICDPNDPRFTSEVTAAFLRTIELARGRTLGLFTSRKRMNEVFDSVRDRTPFRILRQDDGQRMALIEEFKRDIHSVLLGVASFWAGVDVPGESLSCVFIDKIPFPTPDDPVLERLTETDKKAWAQYAVPRAIIEFKQGFGRLIRSATDKGVVVCCDQRLITKGYGKQFLRAMPKGMQKIRNLEAIREWLDGPAAEPAVEEVDPFS
jgi:ATP-dependent DNA helicase DinG